MQSNLKILSPSAEIIAMKDIDVELLPKLLQSTNTAEELEHLKAHWASYSVDLPNLPQTACIHKICSELPKSILRV